MVFDSHVHIGQFREHYYSPSEVLRYMRKSGISQFAYSSPSTIISNDIGFLKREIKEMQEHTKGNSVPLQWITREMLQKHNSLEPYLTDSIKGLKIHGSSQRWIPNGNPLRRIFSIAKERELPVLIHTGQDK